MRSSTCRPLGMDRLANEPVHPLPRLDRDLDFASQNHHDQQQEKKILCHLYLQG